MAKTPDMYLTSKDKKIFLVECKSFSDSVNSLYSLFGSDTRAGIVSYLLVFGKANKLKIYEALKERGVKISYKNTLWTLDKLEEDGLVIFEHVKEQNNAVYVTLDKKRVMELYDHSISELNRLKHLIH